MTIIERPYGRKASAPTPVFRPSPKRPGEYVWDSKAREWRVVQ